MSERAAFISAILDNLDDDTPRLVFADWLQEHGEEARAEFIRCQIETARLLRSGLGQSEPFSQATALEVAHRRTWRAALGLKEYEGRYERGFLTGIHVNSDQFLTLVRQLLGVEPATFEMSLQAWREGGSLVTDGDVERLASDPLLRAVTMIWCRGDAFGVGRFVRLMDSPHLANLRKIALLEVPIGLAGIRAIVGARSAFVLESLDLNESLKSDDGEETDDTFEAVQLIATSRRFVSLKHLALMFNRLTDRSIEALLASTTLPRTLRIELEDNDYDEEAFAEALAERFTGGSDGG